MLELNDATLAKLAAICGASKSPEFFTEVRLSVELAHFRERLKRHAQPFEKIAKVAATLLQYIEALSPDARAMFEEILGKKNLVAQNLDELVQSWTTEHAANFEHEQTPLLFAFVTGLSMFEGFAHWIAGLPMPYARAPRGPGPLYLQVAIDGRTVSSRGGRGRPRGSKGLSSGYGNLEVFVDSLTAIVTQAGGRLTFNDHHNSGTLVEALKILQSHLPQDCRAMPSRTMRRIKERSMGHLNRLTPEKLYDGGVVAKSEHHKAIVAALRAVGVDPTTVDKIDIACAAEIHAREGAPPDEAFQIAVAHSLIESGYIDREVAKNVLPGARRPGNRAKPSKPTARRSKKHSAKK
jgi:hypothetical protein